MTASARSDSTGPRRVRTVRMSALAIGIGLSVVGAGAPSAEAAGAVASRPVPLTVDELTRTGAFSLFSSVGSLSSDGRWLAYAVRSCNPPAGGPAASMHAANGMRASNAGCSDLWVMDTKSGVTERVSDGRGNAEDAEWSPDGRRLAYYAAPDGTAGVWVWDRETRKTRRLGTSIARPSYAFYAGRPQWTSDGKFVAALVLAEGTTVARANDRIHARETPEIRRDPTIAPGAHVSVFRAAATPTGSLSPTPGGSEVATDKGDDPIRRETSDLAAVLMCDVALIDAATGETRHVAVDKGLFWYAPSPDGKWLAWSHMTGYRQKMAARTYDIEVAPVGGGPARVLAKDVYPDDGICSWSPDGRELAYLTGQDGDAVADVHVLDVASGADRRLNPKAVPGKASWENRLVGLWTPDARSLIFVRKGGVWRISRDGGPPAQVGSPDSDLEIIAVLADPSGNFVSTGRAGQTLLVSTRRRSTKDMGFWRVELATGRMTKLREEPRDYGYPVPLASSGGSFIVFRSQDARHPEDLWGGAGADLSAARQLTHLNPGLEKVEFGATRLVGYTGAAGESLQAALLLPAGYREGTRVPLIAEVYAGDSKHSNNVNRFGFGNTSGPFNMQMLATRGYAVLFPETPQKIGTPMRDLVANTNLALDAVVSMGIADPDRLGVMGHSYGGYSTIALVTQTQRFKAAVMSSGIADLVTMYGELQDSGLDSWVDWAENGQGALGGTPWQYRERYIENSPFFYLDRVTTPVLILHGSADRSVPVFHGGQVFSALRRLGREVEFRKYDGEGHVLEGRENIVDYWNAVIRWFDGHVKNPASGAKP